MAWELDTGAILLTTGLVKVYLILIFFMELKHAPLAIKFSFELTIFSLWLALVGLDSIV